MNATILDLRYKTREILAALEKRESITVLYRGKPKGMIVPTPDIRRLKVRDHPMFGMDARNRRSVKDVMKKLRGARHDV